MITSFECPHGCGRKFTDKPSLEEHIQRRHVITQQKQFTSLYENMKLKDMTKKQTKILRPKLPQLHQIPEIHQQNIQQQQGQSQLLSESVTQQLPPRPMQKIQIKQKSILRPSSSNKRLSEDQQKQSISNEEDLSQSKEIQSQKAVKILEPSPVVSSQELVEARKCITRQFVCTNSDGSDLQSVTHLTLNDKNLLIFESTQVVPFQDMISLKSLSLSQNRLINAIGISQLHNIIDLNINNNKITTLQPLNECKRLQKLFANYNLINTIDLGLMIHLKIFQVGNNQLTDFQHIVHSVQQMPSLKELVVENNPCTQKQANNYKYDILWTAFLDKLDHKVITQQDYNLAQAFKDSKQESKLSQSMHFKTQRPQTASHQSFVQQQEEYVEENNSTANIVLEQINYELEEEVEELYEINSNLREKIDKLEKQNIEYRMIAERVPFLEEQLQDMRSKISAYETLLIFKDSPENELRKHIFTLTQELEQMKHSNRLNNDVYEIEASTQKNQSKFQNTQATMMIQQLAQVESDNDNISEEDEDDDDDKYFRDDEEISQVPSSEIMDLIMRNSMTLSKLKNELKEIN